MSRSIPPTGPDDDVLGRLLRTPDDASPLRALLAAAAADSAEPQTGEAAALAAYRELVQEPAGIPSLTHRRRARLAVAAMSSVVVLVGSGVAAAAGGALPGGAQQVAKTVLGAVGVHVPGPASASTPSDDGPDPSSGEPTTGEPTPSSDLNEPAPPVQAGRPSTAPEPKPHPSTPPTPGNSGPSRHHGNPTPHATTHPTPHHGKPTAAPITSHRQSPSSHARKFPTFAHRPVR